LKINREIGQLFERYKNQLYLFSLKLSGDKDLAKDIVQDSFLKIFKYLDKGRVVKNPGSLLFKTAYNTFIDINRKTSSPSFISADLTAKNRGGKNISNSYIACVIKREYSGIFFLSVKKFRGSKKIGVLKSKKLKFRYNNNYFELISLEPILPVKGKWIVFGKYIPEIDIKKEKSLGLSPLVGKRGG